MLSYQHGYHAGNFADVVKHFTLTRLLHYLTLKEKPIFYLETHAGKGCYDLEHEQALKTSEASQGIKAIWNNRSQWPDLFQPYIKSIQGVNHLDTLRYYPGSPLLAMRLLRSQDRMIACELHPQEFTALTTLKKIPHQPKVHFRQVDGILELASRLPPPERRGLIFIDPSYEIKSEYESIAKAVSMAYQRFSTGVYCIWYPIIHSNRHLTLVSHLTKMKLKTSLRIEFNLNESTLGMTGCGLWIINPPYILEKELQFGLNVLKELMNQYKPSTLVVSQE